MENGTGIDAAAETAVPVFVPGINDGLPLVSFPETGHIRGQPAARVRAVRVDGISREHVASKRCTRIGQSRQGRIAEFYVQGRSQKVDTAVHRDSVAIQHSMIVFGPKGEARIKRCGSRAGRGKSSSWRDRAPDHQPNLVLFGFVLGSRAG